MPINIFRVTPEDKTNEAVAWLCSGNWRLPDQAKALESWLSENHAKLDADDYVADIGFRPRDDALGGGAAISPQLMRIMVELGMWLFLSEYPGGAEGEEFHDHQDHSVEPPRSESDEDAE